MLKFNARFVGDKNVLIKIIIKCTLTKAKYLIEKKILRRVSFFFNFNFGGCQFDINTLENKISSSTKLIKY